MILISVYLNDIGQLKLAGCEERANLPFQKAILDKKLPYTIGGGIGQSRICMFYLRKAHIGEIQVPLWPEEIRETAKENGIGIAFSNMAFEVWLIDHFERCYTEKTAEKLIADFDRILRAKGYTKGYAKEDKQMITDVLMPRLDEAVHNADVVMQNRVLKYKEYRKDDNYPFCDWNSFTNVHKLIDALKLEKKS